MTSFQTYVIAWLLNTLLLRLHISLPYFIGGEKQWMLVMQWLEQNMVWCPSRESWSPWRVLYWYVNWDPAATKLESYENWVISQWPINNREREPGPLFCASTSLTQHLSLSATLPSPSSPYFLLRFSLCVSLTPNFPLILSLSLLDECVLLGRADSSYLAEALWTIKIWFQSPAGCWAWGLGSQL